MTNRIIITAVPVLIVSIWLIYQIMPVIVVQLDPRLRQVLPAPSVSRNRSVSRLQRWVKRNRTFGLFLEKQHRRMIQAGDERPDALQIYLRSQFYIFIGTVTIGIVFKLPGIQRLLIAVMLIAFSNTRLERKIVLRRNVVERSFYKIYRFIDNQIAAGIKPTDVLQGLHEATDDPLVKPLLIRFVGRYSLTLDLDQAIGELRRLQAGKDVETLGTQLRQLLVTGTAGRSFQRTEALLFTRYFSLLQKQSETVRTRLLIAAILLMLPTLLLFLMPMIYQAVSALNNVFG